MLGIVKAAATTVRAAFRKPVTVQYPQEKKVLPHRSRGFPVLLWDFEKDEPFCTGCQVCARYCPVDCMTVTMKDNPKFAEGKSKRKKIVDQFFIDYARCMRCDICVEVCNFDAVVMNNTHEGYELSRYDRQELVMDKTALMRQHRAGDLQDPFREPMGVAHSGWAPHEDEGDIAAKRASNPATALGPEAVMAELAAARAAKEAAATPAAPVAAPAVAAPATADETSADAPEVPASTQASVTTPPPPTASLSEQPNATEPPTTPEASAAAPPAAQEPAEGGEG